MGRCSATDVFDETAGQVLKNSAISPAHVKVFLKALFMALEHYDWDCQQETEYGDHPLVQEIMRELHPDWFED